MHTTFRDGLPPAKTNGKTTSCGRRRRKRQHSFLDTTAMVRSLQRREGRSDCFRRKELDCTDQACQWRAYCLDQE